MVSLSLQKNQQGIVLILALLMVVAVTGIAVTLMNSSSIDSKITVAVQEREVAENELSGNVQKVIASEVGKRGNSRFLLSKNQITDSGLEIARINASTHTIYSRNNGPLSLNCPRRFDSTQSLKCNLIELSSVVDYGAKSRHSITINAGIAQQMLNTNNSN
ncbi:MAG: pilus assembly protein PilX [Pseudoalteromonadaceae bacterium]|uniref:pilus assembly PilX family protein n=1 Tax=uncultured Pseudoalteromonas sp. TaxID=114053 RepID=UPI000C531A28|nr:pilus assembly PilX N-terminal domain-containing protein [uncultured Pseudoalteromonas sp.]MBD55278.1 pilus assembly protein PilX [Pseudoalteromonas sp.]MBU77079.1 pilus assembly protein PilX [Pseudoalteromonadaceae bacterium]|tara:strand:+ start:1490 stop:1972 length:483 start_codon:yes stop_codon:yes gene_type:complete